MGVGFVGVGGGLLFGLQSHLTLTGGRSSELPETVGPVGDWRDDKVPINWSVYPRETTLSHGFINVWGG